MKKKFLVSLLSAFFLFSSLAISPLSAAKASWYNQEPLQFYSHVYDDSNPEEIYGERYTTAQVDWIIMSFLAWPMAKTLGGDGVVCFGSVLNFALGKGADPGTCLSKLLSSISPNELNSRFAEQNKDKTFAQVFFADRPFSGITYTKQTLTKIKLIPEANAQTEGGFGYGRFAGTTQSLWKASRDASYALFVVVAIILSFMIMFRIKISPQVVISVQSALPKLFIALILVTFSYAIAGFLVDFMYVIIGILSIFLGQVLPNAIPDALHKGSETALTFLFLTQGVAYTGVFGFLLFDLVAYAVLVPITLAMLFGAIVGGGLLIGGAITGILWIIILVVGIVMLIILLVLYFKIILALLKAFAQVLLLVMFAPFMIVLGVVVPGVGFGTWIRSLLANLAVFPTIGVLFALSYLFISEAFNAVVNLIPWQGFTSFVKVSGSGANVGDGWPPLLGASPNSTGSFLGTPAPFVMLMVSLVILFLIPKAADIIKGIMSGKGFDYGRAIGEGMGPGKATGVGGLQYVATRQDASYNPATATNAQQFQRSLIQTARQLKIIR